MAWLWLSLKLEHGGECLVVRNCLTDEANHFHDAWTKITCGTNLEFYNNTIKQKLTYLTEKRRRIKYVYENMVVVIF